MFGGAGGQHACSIANTLGISRIIIPRYSSLLSAYGMALADVVREVQEPAAFTLSGNQDNEEISKRMSGLVERAKDDLRSQGFDDDRIHVETYLNCRYHGTSTKLMIETPEDEDYGKQFYEEHKREFGFNLENRNVLVDDLRVRATGKSVGVEPRSPYKDFDELETTSADLGRFTTKKVYFEGKTNGWKESALVPLSELHPGEQVNGPAIVFDETQTLLVEPGHLVSSRNLAAVTVQNQGKTKANRQRFFQST